MKKTFAIVMALSIMMAHGRGDAGGDVVTPGGVRIESQRVYVTSKGEGGADKSQWMDSALSFSHGNAALRLCLSNPGEVPQEVRVQMPLAIGGRTIILAAGKKVGAGESVDMDMPMPIVGRVGFKVPDDYALSKMHIADAIGEVDGGAGLMLFGYGTGGESRSLYSPSGRNVADDIHAADYAMLAHVAISPAAERFGIADAFNEFAKARQSAGQGGKKSETSMEVESPDFTRFRRWQDLTVYDMVVIDEGDWDGYPQRLKDILPYWVAGGGLLALIGTEQPPIQPGNYGLGKVVFLGASSPDFDSLFKTLASTMMRYSLATSPFDCDIKASDAVGALRNETPFSTILIVLLVFCVLAGPVLVITLAKRNSRLSLLWVFPVMAIAFSLGVMGVIVCLKGIDPELRQFVHTIYDEKAGKVVTICNHVILAPFTIQGAIRLDAKDSVVSYMSGDVKRCGDTIIYTGKEFIFRDGWAPTLWPVVFRTVSVRPIAEAPSAPPIPVSGRLQEHYVSATEERRAAK